jgi:hypothetical protein
MAPLGLFAPAECRPFLTSLSKDIAALLDERKERVFSTLGLRSGWSRSYRMLSFWLLFRNAK